MSHWWYQVHQTRSLCSLSTCSCHALDTQSRKLVTIKGLFQFTRLTFGVTSAPAVFQRTMDTVLQGIPQVIFYIDDIIVTGKINTLEILHDIVRTHLFTSSSIFYGKKHAIQIYLENYSTHKHRTSTSM